MAACARIAATLDLAHAPQPGDVLPPAWHWCFCPPCVPTSALGADGHPARGGFLPPVPLPRRMWAASEVQCLLPLRAGETVQRYSLLQDVQLKHGSSGSLVFVTLQHQYEGATSVALRETQQIVYRDADTTGAAIAALQPTPAIAQFQRAFTPGPEWLFRYSALSFNAHRIHYDRDYARREEAYPALVVQGPLLATLLLQLLGEQAPGQQVRSYAFRAIAPAFEHQALSLQGRIDGSSALLWVLNHEQALCLQLTAQFEQ